MNERLMSGVASREVRTTRLRTCLLESEPKEGTPVLFVHGNVSSSRFFEETLAALPRGYHGLAPDLRGFGESETKPVAGIRGLRDFSDDLHALASHLGYGRDRKVHLVGWSLGGGVVMQYAIDHPTEVASITLINPIPPHGMGGTRDTTGTPCWPDYAGSGGGRVRPEFVERLKNGDRSADGPYSPRNVMNNFYFKPPFSAGGREEILLSSVLSTKVGEENYPGDWTYSENWPNTGPGASGIGSALSPKYCDLSAFAEISPKPPVLWIRGAEDGIMSDASLLDDGRIGRLGHSPGRSETAWPGEGVYPPQPMVSQTYAVLDAYQARGGSRQEAILDCGHTPHVEKPEDFRKALFDDFLDNLR